MPSSPITCSDDADSYFYCSHGTSLHFLRAAGLVLLEFPVVRSLAYLRPERHPRMSGWTYVRLG
jgi:hypothetical protein